MDKIASELLRPNKSILSASSAQSKYFEEENKSTFSINKKTTV